MVIEFRKFVILSYILMGLEIRNLTTLCLLNNNGFSLSSFTLGAINFLWIGAQFPLEKFLSYARVLTLHYYFLLMCILLSFKFQNLVLLLIYTFIIQILITFL